ncbi:MAG: four helix bundle protein [Melioribacteraceae bacterium]|nr:four helix bundle protein [Saprospiraceae bacterium]MCF8355757.1 four helix bundle protein [Melioribacteraceae bacterium]MCF8394785.1 four helix bundle protein [Melioribacteraceae bacterium]
MELKRKNINRGYTQLRVWQNSITLFKLVYELLKDLPYELSKTKSNLIDAAHSINRNLSEGYCRKNLKEYLNFLNIALGSTGELFSGMFGLKEIEKISDNNFERFDELHYQVENELIQLIKSLQRKQKSKEWETDFNK